MIGMAIVMGLKPEEVRAMTPNDFWTVVDGWNSAHEPPQAGANAPTPEEVQELKRLYG